MLGDGADLTRAGNAFQALATAQEKHGLRAWNVSSAVPAA